MANLPKSSSQFNFSITPAQPTTEAQSKPAVAKASIIESLIISLFIRRQSRLLSMQHVNEGRFILHCEADPLDSAQSGKGFTYTI